MLKVLGEESGKFKAVASGTLPNGKPVVVNSDGTVSVISASDASVGSAAQFDSGIIIHTAPVFDSSNNKVVVAYRDGSNSNYGTAVVGTVSGSSISFGTPVVFRSNTSQYVTATFDSSNNKVVVAYQDVGNSFRGQSFVGTVSGTSINFGAGAQFTTGSATYINATFDSNSNKVVISYTDDGGSSYGKAIVGTVSGTSISFGTAATFESATTTDKASVFDTSANKVVIAYRDEGNSYYGTAVVGTVSGTSISFGSPTVFESANTDQISCAYDSTNNKTVIAYRDFTNSGHGTAIVGTVSGTSISFGTAVVFEASDTTYTATTFDVSSGKIVIAFDPDPASGEIIVGTVSGTSISFPDPSVNFNARSDWIGSVYDSNAEKVVITYKDDAASAGEAVVFASPSSNLTAENYIGISSGGAVADTGNATVDIIGTVNKDQTGLTAGQKYYVQNDGTLSTTAGDPSVLAGTAISATKLVVKT